MSSSRKLALVIGNENYHSNNQLKYCRKNANDVNETLKNISFTCTAGFDVGKREMLNKIQSFTDEIQDGDVVLFYFSGHVYEIDGKKYLLPVNDSHVEAEVDFRDYGFDFEQTIIRRLRKFETCVTIFILDYHSSYKLPDGSTSKSKGLSEMKAPPETFIQFSCASNETDIDLPGTDHHSLFTKHLLQNIVEPNASIIDVFERVANAVHMESNQIQRPVSINGLKTSKHVSFNEIVPRLRTEDYFDNEPVLPEERMHYERCKEYYQCTGKPLVSVANEVLDDSVEMKSPILKFGIDENHEKFNLDEYLRVFCESANVQLEDLEVKKIQKGSCILTVAMSNNVQQKDQKETLQLIYDSCNNDLSAELGKVKTFFFFLGPEESLKKMQKFYAEVKLNPRFNRKYMRGYDYWEGAVNDGINRGGKPYFCPVGWRRWSFYVGENFNEKFRGWCICYHGTKFEHGLSILFNGLKPAKVAVHGDGVYVSPSIIYVAHPRYSEIKAIPEANRKIFKSGSFVQYALECRVHPKSIKRIGLETLRVPAEVRIDPNIINKSIEWVIDINNKHIADFNDPNSPIICTGLMIRITDDHPALLSDSHWWHRSHLCDKEKCCRIGIDLETLSKKIEQRRLCNIIFD